MGRSTVEIALCANRQTPPRMLRQRMQRMIQEANARVDVDDLALASLAGMGLDVVEKAGVGLRRKVAAIEVDGQLDLGFVGIARKRGPAGFGGFGSHFPSIDLRPSGVGVGM